MDPCLINDAVEEEECLASAGKHHTKYLHLQEPTKLADFLEVQPEDANVANPEKYILKWDEQPKTHDSEVTFRVQGYLVDFNLPPILHSDQSAFLRLLEGLYSITGVDYHGMLPGKSKCCQTWQPSEFEGHVALDFQSPYFTRKSDEKLAQLPENIDPLGHLAHRDKSKGLWPSLDSLVECYERKIVVVDKKQLVHHECTEPATLRRGYLMEVTVVFHLNCTKKGRWMLFTWVRAIEVLNREIDKAYLQWTLSELRCPVPTWRITSKRCREYEEEEEVEMQGSTSRVSGADVTMGDMKKLRCTMLIGFEIH
ncbi:hypothetical protein K439DRAFT_1611248 [Ramaria rubella]|nr:hypothetical protein K439DRAFT_1611248 [Ramaria rubella]